MNTKAHVETQAKTPAAATAARIPQPPVPVPGREADRPDIATQLEGAVRLGHSLGAISVTSAAISPIQSKPLIQRQELPEKEEEEQEVQTKPANHVQRRGRGDGFRLDDETAGRINRVRGGGQPLDKVLQNQMSEALGHDFSSVRLHTDSEADALNQLLGAEAFTSGRDLFFRRGAYEPGFGGGRELIAHELTHVLQQGSGRVSGKGSMTVRPPGDAFEQEAIALAQGAETARSAAGSDLLRQAPGLRSPANLNTLQMLQQRVTDGRPPELTQLEWDSFDQNEPVMRNTNHAFPRLYRIQHGKVSVPSQYFTNRNLFDICIGQRMTQTALANQLAILPEWGGLSGHDVYVVEFAAGAHPGPYFTGKVGPQAAQSGGRYFSNMRQYLWPHNDRVQLPVSRVYNPRARRFEE